MPFIIRESDMKIVIEYDSCWQTSFLDDKYETPISKRKFVATTKTKGDKPAPITLSTIIGVLCRLIGDQRKLYQIQDSDNYYFSDIDEHISFQLKNTLATDHELMYLTNKSEDRCGQSSFLGVLSDDNPWFFSDGAPLLWSVLFLDIEKLLDFVLYDEACMTSGVDCSPKTLMFRLNEITDTKNSFGSVLKTKLKIIEEKELEIVKAEKNISAHIEKSKDKVGKQKNKAEDKLNDLNSKLEILNIELNNIKTDKDIELFERKLTSVTSKLSNLFPNPKKLGEEYCKEGVIYPSSIYSAALYLQAERLLSAGVDIRFVKNNKDEIQIQGFSKRGFNGVRDWLNKMSGGRKKSVGTPCIVQKQTGQLEINIDIDKIRAREIETMIESAGVSSFYLGKKGLAFVSNIRV